MTIPRCSPAENARIDAILDAITAETGVDREAMTSPIRTDRIANARRVAMAIIREQTTLSLHELGDLFRKHHSSVAHAVKDVRQDCGRLAELYRAVTNKPADLRK